ncbi:MAG TPA: glycosyltransferase family 4 protein [Gemmatimonadaceae bacterium]|jgi:glycosyltransferase involved in cell wall biosynthesis|nr:glycosyltransferase family 4 protein [Gemmatimonadaceae bacterium]
MSDITVGAAEDAEAFQFARNRPRTPPTQQDALRPRSGSILPMWREPRSAARVMYLWDADYPWDVRVEKICRALRDAGHEVHIVASNRRGEPESEVLPEGTVHRMPVWPAFRRLDAALSFPAFFNPRWIRHLERTVRLVRPDVIIARDLPLCPTAIHVGRRTGVPVIHDMAEHYPAMIREIFEVRRHRLLDYVVRNPWVVDRVERYCVRHVDRVLVVIEEMRERLIAMGVPTWRIDLVSNTPPVARAANVPRALADGQGVTAGSAVERRPLRLVYLGIMEIPRGIDDLIDAAAKLKEAGRPVHIDLVGTGRDISLFERRAAALGVLGTSVVFHGHVASQEGAFRIIAQADIGILPHRRCTHWDHTIPNKLFDYMAAGLPVVTSDARPFARIVRETRCGEVFRSRDSTDLARAISVLADPALRARYGENGRHAVLDRYHWEHDSIELLNSVERAVSAAGGHR